MPEEKIIKKIDELAATVARGFGEMATKSDIDELAQMTARGFEETATKADLRKLEENVNQKIDALDLRLSAYVSNTQESIEGLRRWVGELDQKVRKLETGREK